MCNIQHISVTLRSRHRNGFRKEQRATAEMENNMAGNPHQPKNEQHRAKNVDHNRSLRDLFAPITINSSSCIVLHLPTPLI
jgi:hypothetical protein